jgi:hypothetical protein
LPDKSLSMTGKSFGDVKTLRKKKKEGKLPEFSTFVYTFVPCTTIP